MQSRTELETTVFFMLLICLTSADGSSHAASGELRFRCKEAEKRALLEFKEGLSGFTSTDVLSSWAKDEEKRECCEWIGIHCNKFGYVTELNLSPSTLGWSDFGSTPALGGNLNSSLLGLPYLKYLDLSYISFYETSSIPSFIGSLRRLKYLNLSYTRIDGEVPPELGNLSGLEILDLSDTFKSSKTMKSMDWVSRLSSLRILDLTFIDLSSAKDWVRVVDNLPYLSNLRLSYSQLPDPVHSSVISINSSRNLAFVDLSGNHLFPSIFQWLFKYRNSLVHLDLSTCYLRSPIPEGLERMTSLEYLNFGANLLQGPIPDSIGNLTAMKFLDLGNNQLEGFIPESLGNMAKLEYLNLGANMLEGEIPSSIWEICTLRSFQAHENNLSGQLLFSESPSKCPHFSLELLNLESNRLRGPLPDFTLYPSLKSLWLQSNQFSGITSESLGQLSQLETLDASKNSIEAVITEAHLSNLGRLSYLDLSSNSHIVFNIRPNWTPPFQLDYILLESCNLGPHFPYWLQNQKSYTALDISNSGISDSISNWFWNLPKTVLSLNLSNNQIWATSRSNEQQFKLRYFNLSSTDFVPSPILDLSSNQLRGSVPGFLFNMGALRISRNKYSDLHLLCNASTTLSLRLLDISHNQLSGELPDCWLNMESLNVLILTNNKLSGRIPSSIGFLNLLEALHLSNNNFIGELPFSFENATELMALDVGQNKLSGSIPAWIWQNLTKLTILSLRENDFNNIMPSQLCHLQNIQVLDLSLNNLSGSIPRCLGYIEAMNVDAIPNLISLEETIFLMWKGAVTEFKHLELLKNIDLSSNKFVGEIPTDITKLSGLVSLNLSRNNLSGQIPREIGQLKSLDVLDLSNNNLCGQIPPSLTQVDRLNILDLSNNNLSGKIPTGTQLQTRDPAAYLGNPELCGDPLLKKCTIENDTEIPPQYSDLQQDQDGFITAGFYISLGVGFIVGFWGVCGTLILNKSLRYRYFKLFHNVRDRTYVLIELHKAKLLQMIRD